jgi:hypothetical protein
MTRAASNDLPNIEGEVVATEQVARWLTSQHFAVVILRKPEDGRHRMEQMMTKGRRPP